MNIWNKVLLGLLIFMALPFFYVAARTLKAHQSWRGEAQRLENQISQLQEQNEVLAHGGNAQEGIQQVESRLFDVTFDRGRVWFDIQPMEPELDQEKQTATMTLSLPERYDAQSIEDGLVLYLFEAANVQQGGRYLGEFKVSGVGEGQIVVVNTLPLRSEQLERVKAAQGPWVAYETMPNDRHLIWSLVSDETIQELMPDDVEDQYLRHGEPAADDDPPEQVVDGKYIRPLRSYGALFYEMDRLRSIDTDRIAAAQKDLEFLRNAIADAERQQEYRLLEISRRTAELKELTAEQQAVAAEQEKVGQQLAKVREQIVATLASNQQLAAAIAEYQFEAAAEFQQTPAN